MTKGALGTLAWIGVAGAVRDRWFGIVALAFSALTLLVSAAALTGTDVVGFSAFDRTAASLISLTLLFVPLLGLVLGSGWIAGQRESGVLSLLLAQPVSRAQVYAAEYAGVAAAVVGATVAGFGLAGLVLSVRVGSERVAAYLSHTGLSVLLAVASLSIGFLVSAASPTYGRAVGLGLFLWLLLVVLSDLGILGVALSARIGAAGLFWLAVANPVDVYRIAAILSVVHAPDLTGAVGLYAASLFGETGARAVLLGVLTGWVVAPFAAGLTIFCRRAEP